jgi:telomere length regulation protein
MELILLILSSSHSLDGGHTLTRSSFEVLTEVQSWAEEVFEIEENKSGGAAVGRAGRAAAGVLLRLEEILGRWRGRVGWE